MNRFGEPMVEDTSLYCLANGQTIPDEVEENMLNIFVWERSKTRSSSLNATKMRLGLKDQC